MALQGQQPRMPRLAGAPEPSDPGGACVPCAFGGAPARAPLILHVRQPSRAQEFKDGIVNGAEWYPV